MKHVPNTKLSLADTEMALAIRIEDGIQSSDPRIRRALAYVRQRLAEPLRVPDLARHVLLSKSRFGYLFRKETNYAPAQMVKLLRLRMALRMLTTSELSVKEVAAHVGLNDVSHFVRDFEAAFGSSPARYRKLVRSQNESKDGSLSRPTFVQRYATANGRSGANGVITDGSA